MGNLDKIRADDIGQHKTAFDKNKKRILATQSICGICGRPVDKSLRYPNPMAPSYIDSFFEADARSKQTSGIGSVIQRRQLWNCCEWCARLAGSYPYAPGKYPEDIFRRHENCRCLVTVKTDKSGYTDVWSKKEYESQREARIAREQEIVDDDYEKRIRIARDSGEEYIDATDHWNWKPKKSEGSVKDAPKVFEYKGQTYTQNGKTIFIKDDDDEVRIAELWKEKFGANVMRIPEIKVPKGIKTPDYEIDGKTWDLKMPKKATSERWLDDAVKEQKEQTQRFIFDISKSVFNEKRETFFAMARRTMNSPDRSWIEAMVVVSGDKVIYVLERIK